MAYATAATLISDAASELGLVAAAVSNPYTSTDPNLYQLCALLKALGQDMTKEHRWTHLQKEYQFSTSNGTYVYSFPSDYLRFIDQTAWNRNDQLPLGGPASAKEWQTLKASSVSTVVYDIFRTINDELWIHPTPTGTETLSFEYVSSSWVEPVAVAAELDCSQFGDGKLDTVLEAVTAGTVGNSITVNLAVGGSVTASVNQAGTVVSLTFVPGVSTVADVEAAIGSIGTVSVKTAGTGATVLVNGSVFTSAALSGGLHTTGTADADTPSAATDTIHFEKRMMVTGLKLYWKREKGFDTTTAQADFDRALELAKGADGAAPIVGLNKRTDARLIDTWNLPQTNYGQ